MAGDALTASTGLYLDDLNKVRVLEPEISTETETLKDECSDFLKKTENFKTIADSFVQHVDTLQSHVEREKMKGIGYRNLLKSVAKQRCKEATAPGYHRREKDAVGAIATAERGLAEGGGRAGRIH